MAATEDQGHVLPDDRSLAEVASALDEAGYWAEILDPEWRVVFVTEPLRIAEGFLIETAPSRAGLFRFGTEYLDIMVGLPTGGTMVEMTRRSLACVGGWLVEDLPGGFEELRSLVDPRLVDVVDPTMSVDASSTFTFDRARRHLPSGCRLRATSRSAGG